jgi:hypothetical protein
MRSKHLKQQEQQQKLQKSFLLLFVTSSINFSRFVFVSVVIKNSYKIEMSDNIIVIDGKGHLLGRLASVVAKQTLQGKHIVVVRSEAIVISGSRKFASFHYFIQQLII